MERKATSIVDFNPNWERHISEELQKSIYSGKPRKHGKAYKFDPLALLDVLEFKDRPSSLSFDFLKRMANRDSVVSAIINTRLNQVSRFSYPSRTREDKIGYKVRRKDPKDNTGDNSEAVALENFIFKCGSISDFEVRDDFASFLKKVARDRLVYDAVAVELVTNKVGELVSFYPVDAATVRRTKPTTPNGVIKKSDTGFIQVIQGKEVCSFNYEELAYGLFYPRSDITSFGYGFSELEQLVTIITAHLWGEQYNSKIFSQGTMPKGILNFKMNTMNRDMLLAFRREWQTQVTGLTGAWRVPVVASPDLQWIPMTQTNQDMEFSKWLDYLVNVVCSVYCIDPAEINFPSRGGSGDSHEKPLFDNSYESKLRQSKDKGLYPLLDFFAHFITVNIVEKVLPDHVFVFEGLDRKMGMERLAAQEKEVRMFKTVNDLRKEEELLPIDGGDILLDPIYMQSIINQGNMELQIRDKELQEKQQIVALKKMMLETIQLEQEVLGGAGDASFVLSKDDQEELDAMIATVKGQNEPVIKKWENEEKEVKKE